jgi:ribokinase
VTAAPRTPVLCLGHVMVDVVAVLRAPFAPGSDTPAAITTQAGGSAANTAAWLADAGIPTLFVGRVGDDEYGRSAVRALSTAGVRPRVSVDPVRPTGTCIVLVGPDGERSMLPEAGANAGLSPHDLAPEKFAPEGFGHLHMSGYALLNSGSRTAALGALTLAAERRASVSVDPGSAALIEAAGADRFLGWVDGAALLVVNADEATTLTGSADPSRAAARLADRFGAAVVKLGAGGALWSGRNGAGRATTVRVAAEPVEVVSTTGAGDAFAAGLLAAWLAGEPAGESLRAGCRRAALAVGQLGSRPARTGVGP